MHFQNYPAIILRNSRLFHIRHESARRTKNVNIFLARRKTQSIFSYNIDEVDTSI